jgi:AcrR family transcriptional regulator
VDDQACPTSEIADSSDTAPQTGDTRARILESAGKLFGERGYKRTTIQAIAGQLGISKATVLYHFPTKDHILFAIAEPMIVDLEQAVALVSDIDPELARLAAVEAWLDALLRHRDWLRMIMHDLALLTHGPFYQRMLRVSLRLNELVAGPDADQSAKIRATQITGAIGDPVVYFPNVPASVIRTEVLTTARHMLSLLPQANQRQTQTSEPADPLTPATGRLGARRAGRPTVMTSEKLVTARRLHQQGTHRIDEIAHALGVSRATLYRHLNSTDPS